MSDLTATVSPAGPATGVPANTSARLSHNLDGTYDLHVTNPSGSTAIFPIRDEAREDRAPAYTPPPGTAPGGGNPNWHMPYQTAAYILQDPRRRAAWTMNAGIHADDLAAQDRLMAAVGRASATQAEMHRPATLPGTCPGE
jgi:hypothetical protein